MKAAFTVLAIREMLLYNFDFVNAEFPVNIQMKTSCCLITIHVRFGANTLCFSQRSKRRSFQQNFRFSTAQKQKGV